MTTAIHASAIPAKAGIQAPTPPVRWMPGQWKAAVAKSAENSQDAAMRIGLVTDTHIPSTIRHLWDEVKDVFAGVNLILHGGDIVTPRVLDWLEQIAPVLAAEGNNDGGWDDPRMQPIHWLDLEGWRLVMIHDMEPEERPIARLKEVYLKGRHADIMVSGHTHYERLDYRDGVLQINTGSATHPHLWSTRLGTVGLLDLAPGKITARIVKLGDSPELPNPGQELFFDLETHQARRAAPASFTRLD